MIAQTHVRAMHGVDEIKISPHETVASVHGVESAPQDARPGIEAAAGVKAGAAELLGTHSARLKGNPVVAVAIVQPPFVEEQPVFPLEPVIERSAGKRGQMIEGGDVESVFLGKLHRWGEALRRVAIVPEDERTIDSDAMA